VATGVEGREHAVSYLSLDSLQAIGKLTAKGLVEHAVPDTQRISEPVFVPRQNAAGEDDGWLLALSHDGTSERAFVAVYDAARIPDGPVARVWFDHQIPITFHGTFVPMR
jgi:all-trans-8'-apo-beta-carotenal 15,15'-oxygenase